MTDSSQDWRDWSKFVLKAIEKLESKVEKLENKLIDLKLEFQAEILELKAKSKTYSMIFGAIASILVSVISALIVYFIKSNSGGNG